MTFDVDTFLALPRVAGQHARVWYGTVLAWLDHHLLGKEWERPNLL
ncbi:MAG: hypothetical protein ACRD0C_21475 [Acidimicrobiia bacterium]